MWKDNLKKNIGDWPGPSDMPKQEKCGYCGKDMTNAGVHDRHSTRFKDTENPICSDCNWRIEIPRRYNAMQGDKHE